MPHSRSASQRRLKVLWGLLALYFIWGTPFLARRVALETIPPLMISGCRFLCSGLLVCLYAWIRSPVRAGWPQWRSSFIVGACLLLGGNGAVVWAQQTVDSGVAALFVAMVPIWMVLVDWAWNRGPRPSGWVLAGLVLGFAGIVILTGLDDWKHLQELGWKESSLLLFSAFSWAAGSIYARRAPLSDSHLLTIGMQMLAGGILLLLASLLLGEPFHFNPAAVSLRSAFSVLYLIAIPSLIGYNIYVWILHTAPPAQVGTYAFVNPVVAIFLGWKFAGEAVTLRTAWAAILIIIAVAVIVAKSPRIQAQDKEPLDVQ